MSAEQVTNLEALPKMPLHIPASQAQVFIAVQAGCEPAVLQRLC